MIRSRKGVEIGALLKVPGLSIVETLNNKWLNKKITHPDTQKPGLALTGYTEFMNKGSLQIFGKTEVGYLNQLNHVECKKRLNPFLSNKVPSP